MVHVNSHFYYNVLHVYIYMYIYSIGVGLMVTIMYFGFHYTKGLLIRGRVFGWPFLVLKIFCIHGMFCSQHPDLPPIKKVFYHEHPAVANMDEEEVEKFRYARQ